MLSLLNFSVPVLIYFLTNLVIVFILQSYFYNNKSTKYKFLIFKLLIIVIIFTLLLQLLHNSKFKITVWLLVLSPIIFIIFLIFLYIFMIIKVTGKFEIKSLVATYKMLKTILSFKINSFNFAKLNIL